jgi:membrane protease YdiL (CAAX protease family)
MEGVTMKRALFWGTLVAGAVAAYMMYRRGESLGVIAAHTVINPVGSLVTELKTASS